VSDALYPQATTRDAIWRGFHPAQYTRAGKPANQAIPFLTYTLVTWLNEIVVGDEIEPLAGGEFKAKRRAVYQMLFNEAVISVNAGTWLTRMRINGVGDARTLKQFLPTAAAVNDLYLWEGDLEKNDTFGVEVLHADGTGGVFVTAAGSRLVVRKTLDLPT